MRSDKVIKDALIDSDHAYLYLNDASFKNSVDTLVQMLPYFIDGLAIAATKSRAERERLLKEMMGLSKGMSS